MCRPRHWTQTAIPCLSRPNGRYLCGDRPPLTGGHSHPYAPVGPGPGSVEDAAQADSVSLMTNGSRPSITPAAAAMDMAKGKKELHVLFIGENQSSAAIIKSIRFILNSLKV